MVLKMMSSRLSVASARTVVGRNSSLLSSIHCASYKSLTFKKENDSLRRFPNFSPQVRGFKPELKIKWVKPAKIPCIKPEKSGDLKPVPELNKKEFPLGYDKSQELKDADENVKKVLSLEFMPRSKSTEALKEDFVNKVKRHALDKQSLEAKIAAMTSIIRKLQADTDLTRKNVKLKVFLKEIIDRRKKFLKYLRQRDYKKFEWLLDELDLVYHPPPEHFHWVTRKDSLRKLADRYCENIKQERLSSYKDSLDSQKVAFLQEKAAKLQWIIEEEKACGVEPSVSENDISEVLKQLKELEIRKEITGKTQKKF